MSAERGKRQEEGLAAEECDIERCDWIAFVAWYLVCATGSTQFDEDGPGPDTLRERKLFQDIVKRIVWFEEGCKAIDRAVPEEFEMQQLFVDHCYWAPQFKSERARWPHINRLLHFSRTIDATKTDLRDIVPLVTANGVADWGPVGPFRCGALGVARCDRVFFSGFADDWPVSWWRLLEQVPDPWWYEQEPWPPVAPGWPSTWQDLKYPFRPHVEYDDVYELPGGWFSGEQSMVQASEMEAAAAYTRGTVYPHKGVRYARFTTDEFLSHRVFPCEASSSGLSWCRSYRWREIVEPPATKLLASVFPRLRGELFQRASGQPFARTEEALKEYVGGKELSEGEAAHLLSLLDPEDLIRERNESPPYVIFAHHRAIPFAVNMANTLQEAAEAVGCVAELETDLGATPGPLADKVLHYVLRRGPREALREWVIPRRGIREHFIDTLLLPVRFKREWDPSDAKLVATLVDRLCFHLGEQRAVVVKTFSQQAEVAVSDCDSSVPESLRYAVSRLGRLLERELKALLLSWTIPANRQWSAPAGVQLFDPSELLGKIAAACKKLDLRSGDGPLRINDKGDWTLFELVTLLRHIEKLRENLEPGRTLSEKQAAQLKAALDRLQQDRLAEVRNAAVHDRSSSALSEAEMAAGMRRMAAFIRFVDGETRLLPRFVRYQAMSQQAGWPCKVQFRDAGTEEEIEFFIHPPPDLTAGPIYGLVDATENTVSLNPLIVDWTKWFAGDEAPDDAVLI